MNDASTKTIVLESQKLCKRFTEGKQHVDVLKDLDLALHAGEMLSIIGVSGVGKSTLLQCLGGLDTINSGAVFVAGQRLSDLNEALKSRLRNQHMGFVYQFHHLLPEFNALENVAMPLLIRGVLPKDASEVASKMIEDVGLAHRTQHRIGELSGGERQRIAIARALVTQPKCVLADEPTGNLDTQTADKVFELMRDLNQKYNTSFIIVTHNQEMAKRLDRVLILEEKKLHDY